MAKTRAKERGVEEARNQLPQLLEDAAGGRAKIITRHGRPVAALVALQTYQGASKQKSLLDLEGSGRRLCGRNSTKTLSKLRDEWSR
jgi:prevent-host-death family protein